MSIQFDMQPEILAIRKIKQIEEFIGEVRQITDVSGINDFEHDEESEQVIKPVISV